jgi:hypothetical protein
MLPRVKIFFENGALGSVVPSPDGVLGMVLTGAAVAGKFVLGTAYQIRKFADLETTLGITTVNNANIVKQVGEFYDMAPEGTELWLLGCANTVSMATMCDKDEAYAKTLIIASNGRVRGIIVSRTPAGAYVPTITHGLDDDVAAALIKAQALGEWAAVSRFAPVFVLIEGRSYSGTPADLSDLTLTEYNRAGVLIGDTVSDSKNACMGLLAARIAVNPVQRNIGRVKDGALPTLVAYIGNKAVELADVESIHDKGYITLRTFVGRAGYFFTDDSLATKVSDDYRSITARRTIDKAYRIAYDTMLEQLLDEIPVNEDGTMQLTMIKSWQGLVENAIANQMTANGELSADVTNPKDRGVECYIDPTQNVVSTSLVKVQVRVRPFGYGRYIDVYLGFKTVNV